MIGVDEVVKRFQELGELVKKFNDIPLNRRILDLENEVIDLAREKRRSDEEIEELRAKLNFKGKLEFKSPFYYQEGDKTAFCAKCWEGKEKLASHLVFKEGDYAKRWSCPQCGWHYEVSKPESPGSNFMYGGPQGWMR